MYKVGIGYDSHRFCDGRPLKLGGIRIEYDKGLKGHSDGDVLLHAIADALLGAASLGEIGIYFPDTDIKYKDIDSKIILEDVVRKVKSCGYNIINLDCVIIAEEPKLNIYYDTIINEISNLVGIIKEYINIKAKTNEGMGFIGNKEGIACFAIVLLEKSN